MLERRYRRFILRLMCYVDSSFRTSAFSATPFYIKASVDGMEFRHI